MSELVGVMSNNVLFFIMGVVALTGIFGLYALIFAMGSQRKSATVEGPPAVPRTVTVKGKKYVLASEVDEHLSKEIVKTVLSANTKKLKNRTPEPDEVVKKSDEKVPWYDRPDS